MGTPAFSVPVLEGLIENGYDIQAVVTQPDRPVGRKKVIMPTPIKEAAIKHNLLVLQPEKISGSPEMEKIIQLAPDLIVTAAFGQFLPEKILNAPKFGAINVHASLLPKYRGGAPVHYSIIDGEKETGVTIMEMVKKMDAGAILSQKVIPITKADDVGTLFERLSVVGKDLLLETLPKLLTNEITAIPQDERQVTFSPNITREQEQIDWHKTAEQVDNQVRGMRPWPIAFTKYKEKNWKIWDVAPLDETTTAVPGTIIKCSKKELWIACGEGTILSVNILQPSGKGKLFIQDFLNGVGKTVTESDKVG